MQGFRPGARAQRTDGQNGGAPVIVISHRNFRNKSESQKGVFAPVTVFTVHDIHGIFVTVFPITSIREGR